MHTYELVGPFGVLLPAKPTFDKLSITEPPVTRDAGGSASFSAPMRRLPGTLSDDGAVPIRISADGRELTGLLAEITATAGRRVLGITGPPGSGKTTLATAITRATSGSAFVPMDGFHLGDAELRRRAIHDRKGTPETFDAWGYAALLRRLHERPDHTVMAPGFDRDLEQPLAGVIAVPPTTWLIVTEGNYLLLDRPEWRAGRSSIDTIWHVTLDDELRRERLVARHVAFGKTPAEARAWIARVDEPNATLVGAASRWADVVLDLSEWQADFSQPRESEPEK
jgi:pantothenate kinase